MKHLTIEETLKISGGIKGEANAFNQALRCTLVSAGTGTVMGIGATLAYPPLSLATIATGFGVGACIGLAVAPIVFLANVELTQEEAHFILHSMIETTPYHPVF